MAAARRHGVSVMFTLSGGHVFPLYDAVVKDDAGPPMRLVDVRHEQTAVFAAEATARLTRTPGLAVVTAGPGVTNSVSAVTTAWFNGAPVVVLAGRAPDYRWGAGSLQEMDHPPLLAPVTKRAWTEHETARLAGSVDEAFRLAASPHRGPVFLDISLEALYGQAEADLPAAGPQPKVPAPDGGEVDRVAALLRTARHPVLVLGSDVWLGDAEPIHPARVYAELLRVLEETAVVIGDGGDFVSFAGKYIEPGRPGGWLDPGPYGCLGTGLGYAIAARLARPSAQVVLLLGDGAAGFSLMDADTLVRHRLPVVIVCGNNGAWGLEKHPMRAVYGYDVLADLQPGCRYDEVVRALGGAGELVTSPAEIAPALRRALAANVPYLVNVVTDPEIAYPRSTTGV